MSESGIGGTESETKRPISTLTEASSPKAPSTESVVFWVRRCSAGGSWETLTLGGIAQLDVKFGGLTVGPLVIKRHPQTDVVGTLQPQSHRRARSTRLEAPDFLQPCELCDQIGSNSCSMNRRIQANWRLSRGLWNSARHRLYR